MHQRNEEPKLNTQFLQGDEIDLTEYKNKGYCGFELFPFTNGRIAIIFNNYNSSRTEIVIFDTVTCQKVFTIPKNLRFKNEVIDLDLAQPIGQLPNGNIIINVLGDTYIWDPLNPECIDATEIPFKSVVAINDENFAIIGDKQINFFKTLESKGGLLPFHTIKTSQKDTRLRGLFNNQFVLIQANSALTDKNTLIFYQIEERTITQVGEPVEVDKFALYQFIKERQQILAIQKISLDEIDDVEDSYQLTIDQCSSQPTASESKVSKIDSSSLYKCRFYLLPDHATFLVFNSKMMINGRLFCEFLMFDSLAQLVPQKVHLPYTENLDSEHSPFRENWVMNTGQILYGEPLSFEYHSKIESFIPDVVLQLSVKQSKPLIESATPLPSGVARIVAEYAGLFAGKAPLEAVTQQPAPPSLVQKSA